MRIGKTKKIAGFEPRTSCILHGCSTTARPALIPEWLLDGIITKIDAKLGKHITCRLVSDVRCGPRRPTRAGHDVAGMGLPGHLDSLGPDSEVLARVLASTSRLHAGSFEVARRTGSDAGLQPVTVENHLQAATGHWGHGWPVEGGHSEATVGTEIVIVAISRTCCPGWVRLPDK